MIGRRGESTVPKVNCDIVTKDREMKPRNMRSAPKSTRSLPCLPLLKITRIPRASHRRGKKTKGKAAARGSGDEFNGGAADDDYDFDF